MRNKLLLGAAALLAAIQFLPAPAKTNPPVDTARTFDAAMHPPAPVRDVLRRACYDCHSDETRWPWYADIAPVSYPVRQHVLDGRRHLNFSTWLAPGETSFSSWSDLEDICTVLKDNSMPLAGYDWMHPEAKLNPPERQAVCAWVDERLANAR
jgi:hypothetical protein